MTNQRPAVFGEPLTDREVDVLALVAADLTDAQIAGELGLSTCTVQTHMKRIRAKLGVVSRAGAVAVGYHRGLLWVPSLVSGMGE